MSVTRSRVSGGHGEHFAAERRDREYRHVRRCAVPALSLEPPNDPGADGHDAVVGRPEFAFARGATWLSQLRVLIGPDQLDCQRNMSAGRVQVCDATCAPFPGGGVGAILNLIIQRDALFWARNDA